MVTWQGDNGRTGSSRSNAWIAVFSSTQKTAACVGGFAPCVTRLFAEVREVHPAIAAAGLKVEEGLRGSIQIQHGLQPIARPFDGGDALRFRALVFGVAFGERGDVVDKHCVENAVFVNLLRTVAGVKVAGDAFVLEDNGPGNSGGVRREKSAAWSKGKRLHISHDTLEYVAAA